MNFVCNVMNVKKSMQFVMNKCFLNLEKNWRRSILSFSTKAHTLILKNDVTEPKARLLEWFLKA